MNKQEIISLLDNSTVWTKDRFGHYKNETPSKVYRIKIQDRSLRLETQITIGATQYSSAKKEWIKIDGAFFGNCSVSTSKQTGNPVLVIGKKALKV